MPAVLAVARAGNLRWPQERRADLVDAAEQPHVRQVSQQVGVELLRDEIGLGAHVAVAVLEDVAVEMDFGVDAEKLLPIRLSYGDRHDLVDHADVVE
jgi:hypothetical protein